MITRPPPLPPQPPCSYANGQHRWVVYAGEKSFYDVDSSTVPPEWHGWLHHTTDAPPTATTVGSTGAVPPKHNSVGSSAPYARALGGVVSEHVPNTTQMRSRGWGVGNGLAEGTRPFDPPRFWTQPGFPTDPRNRALFKSSRRVSFTLGDTPASLLARSAAEAGMSLRDFRHAEALKAVEELSPAVRAKLLAAVEGLGEGHELKDAAVYLSGGGQAPAAPSGPTLVGEVERALTPEERAALGASEETLLLRGNQFQELIDEYKGFTDKASQRGVAEALEKRDAVLRELALHRAAVAKVAALKEEFGARAMKLLEEEARPTALQ